MDNYCEKLKRGETKLGNLSKMRTIYKTKIADALFQEQNKVMNKISTVQDKIEDLNIQITDFLWEINESQDTWDNTMDQFNQKIINKASEFGVT